MKASRRSPLARSLANRSPGRIIVRASIIVDRWLVAHLGRCWKVQSRGKGGSDVSDWNEVKPMLKSRSSLGYGVERAAGCTRDA